MDEKLNLYLKKYLGLDAEFKDGQVQAIKSALNNEKILLVQKTGWGKSLVYFLTLKLLKERNPNGVGIIITPLLSLIRDQINKASEFGLRASKLTSDQDEFEIIETNSLILNKQIDLLFISPERFANKEFMALTMPKLDIILFVIDEAHCISDWGHDFRPDYMNLVEIFKKLPTNTPLIMTTATANDRVVNDIKNQFGNSLNIIRGPLTRESLRLQIIELPEQATRLAWLKDNLSSLMGSGIIYTSTVKDASKVASWLKLNNISVLEYHGRLETNEREEREQMLLNNEIKALVSTVALGMGFDKGDLSFIIHFQTPGSLVTYYQEIGRAGRKLDDAYIVLLAGSEDEEIQLSFINDKVTDEQTKEIWDIILNEEGMGLYDILKRVNRSQNTVKKILKTLEIKHFIYKERNKYHCAPKPYIVDHVKDKIFKEVQLQELEDIKAFIKTKDCYMKYIAHKLSDHNAKDCGKCSNCVNQNIVPTEVDPKTINEAVNYLNKQMLSIEPRKKLPNGLRFNNINLLTPELVSEFGRSFSIYGDTGYGKMIKTQKFVDKSFSDELISLAANYIKTEWKEAYNAVTWVTCVPSFQYPGLVEKMALKIAKSLNLPFKLAIKKTKETRPLQRDMKNTSNQYLNALNSFAIDKQNLLTSPVLIIDDLVDSRMSFLVCGLLLKSNGVSKVYPFALASKGGNTYE